MRGRDYSRPTDNLFLLSQYTFSVAFSANMRNSLKGAKGGRSWEKLVGYSVNDLIDHLESRFHEGMTWDNYGAWHIDHIRPIDSFNYLSPEDEEFRECWALQNLQPLWALENMRKGSKIL